MHSSVDTAVIGISVDCGEASAVLVRTVGLQSKATFWSSQRLAILNGSQPVDTASPP
eukprot:SAG31_NODE_39918_length_284_cov_1.113514_1_plen_56_part_10